MFQKGYRVYVLDGDNIRRHLSSDLGFSPDDRQENLRRVAEVSRLFAEAGMLVITAFIAPYLTDRSRVREIAETLPFHEVYIKADLATCESRDPKGLYKKARAGEIPEFTGVSAPYEPPQSPDLVIDTESLSPEEALEILVRYVDEHFALDTKVWGYSI
jgi:bifunctional enzyme CysN/CysC